MYDMIGFNNIFKINNNFLPDHFERVYNSYNHNARNRDTNYKIKYSGMTYKVACSNVKCPKLWNQL